MTRYLIIDDEFIAHEIIKGYCDMMPNMQLMKSCHDALEALEYLNNHTVDLIFLDLNMPKLTGFEMLRTLKNPPKVIVTTAYREHALEGYELDIVDYLLKPFSFARFLQAVNKALNKPAEQISTVASQEVRGQNIFLRSDKKHIQVNTDDILFLEAAGNYLKVLTKEKTITIREKISDLMQKLPEGEFIQVHKSFVVAKNHIESIEGNRIIIREHTVPIGNTYKLNVSQILK
ncbi:MAG: LytTR family DNA-binding domain-containing protein [Bacteroidota bacterium]